MEMRYQDFLRKEFEFRQLRNPKYSLRAFSRDLEVPAPKLSQILKGRGGISPDRATQIAPKLHLGQEEAQLFVTLVAVQHSRSHLAKKQAKARLEGISQSAEYGSIQLETFKVISDWYHFAILELTETVGFKSSIPYISERLRISVETAKEAIQRLQDLGLLMKKSGRWLQTNANLATPTGVPSQAIRHYHRQILAKADEALDFYPVEQRDFSASTIPVAESQMAEAKEEIRKFRRELAKKLSKGREPKERVYSLAIQFFPLDKI